MGERIRAVDWALHPLGPPALWPQALQVAMGLCLGSSFPTAVYWGPELFLLYNDAWSEIPAEKHPDCLGRPAHEVWPDIWDIIGPQFRSVLSTGEGIALYETLLPMVRGGAPRETWWNYSFTAIRHADGSVGGVFNQGNEVTAMVLGRRARQAELARWRDLFGQAPAGVALLRGPQHVFEFANASYLRLVGERDVIGKPVQQALPEIASQGFITLLDQVWRTGEPYLGAATAVQLQRNEGSPPEDRVVDFVFQPVRDGAGAVDGIFVLVTDVTERARAEAALRLSNWQLGEERARLHTLVEAEQRAQAALRRFNDTLEAHVRQRTLELSRALQAQEAVTARLRATFDTDLIFQGFLDPQGCLLDANRTSLAAIGRTLPEVVGLPFWQSPWFTATPGAPQLIRQAVAEAAAGHIVRQAMEVNLPVGRRRFNFSLRPVFNQAKQLVGMVPEAVEIDPGR